MEQPDARTRLYPHARLHHADWRVVVPGLPDASVDLVSVDPPYGVTDNAWDAVPELAGWWEAIERVAKPAAVIAIFCQQPFTTDLILSRRKLWRYELIWHKSRPTGFLDARFRPLRAHEQIQIFCRKLMASTYNAQRTAGAPYRSRGKGRQSSNWGAYGSHDSVCTGGRCPRSVLNFASVTRGDGHPTQKPVELLEWIVRTYSNPGDRVLDCFMGSGTAGVAAVRNGREFVGVEREGKYFEIAARRIEAAALGKEPVTGAPRRGRAGRGPKRARDSRAMRDCRG